MRGDRQVPSHSYILVTKTWTSLRESSARSTVARVPFDAPSQNATSTSQASTRRWLRAADLLVSASSSNDAGSTWTGMPLARAAFVAAASTPLALPRVRQPGVRGPRAGGPPPPELESAQAGGWGGLTRPMAMAG